MSNVIEFSKYKGRVPSGRKPAPKVEEKPKLTSRCEQVQRLVVGQTVAEVDCLDDENFALIFSNGAKLNLEIDIKNDLNEIIKIIESNNFTEDE